MRFLLRTAFWLAVVIMLIPVDDEVAREVAVVQGETPISTFEAVGAARQALDDVGGFCDRNPDVCDLGSRLGTTFALKARTGAEWVTAWLDEELAAPVPPATVGGVAAPAAGEPAPGAVPVEGTLTPADRAPGWAGAPADGSI